jgi:hypothetical protein
MRVLLDEGLPTRYAPAREAGLAGKKNGLLVELASAQFDVLVTIDRNLPAQQDISGRSLSVIVRWRRLPGGPALPKLACRPSTGAEWRTSMPLRGTGRPPGHRTVRDQR